MFEDDNLIQDDRPALFYLVAIPMALILAAPLAILSTLFF